jgi:hypothetical protein
LTSDDVATKNNLSLNARLLRPMALDMAISEKSLDTFFSTQLRLVPLPVLSATEWNGVRHFLIYSQ